MAYDSLAPVEANANNLLVMAGAACDLQTNARCGYQLLSELETGFCALDRNLTGASPSGR